MWSQVSPPALFILTAAEMVTSSDQRNVRENYASRAKQVIYKKCFSDEEKGRDVEEHCSTEAQNQFQLDASVSLKGTRINARRPSEQRYGHDGAERSDSEEIKWWEENGKTGAEGEGKLRCMACMLIPAGLISLQRPPNSDGSTRPRTSCSAASRRITQRSRTLIAQLAQT